MPKIDMIGEKGTYKDKAVRKVFLDGKEYSAWEKVADAMDLFKVGEEVEVKLSDNGKYINAINRPGQAPIGGFAGKGGGFQKREWKEDPEKNVSVYTSYVLEHMLTFKDGLTPEEAVKQLFHVRSLVKKALGPAEEKADAATSDADKIKRTALEAILREGLGQDPSKAPWPEYITKRMKTKDGFQMLQLDLNAAIAGTKNLVALADGTPAFIPV